MKIGAATSGNELAPWIIFWATIEGGKPPHQANAKAASPIAA